MERIPPHNIEAEQSVLSAVLLDDNSFDEIADYLTADDYYLSSHQLVWTAMTETKAKGLPVDILTLTDRLGATGKLEAAGGPAAVSALGGQVSTAANIMHWAKIVRDKSILRKVIIGCGNVMAEAYDEPGDVEEIVADTEKIALDIISRKSSDRHEVRVDEAIHDVMEWMEKISLEPELAMGVNTGFETLNNICMGFHAGNFNILAGRPSQGKTTMALNMSIAAAKAGSPVLVFTLEQETRQLAETMLCANSQVKLSDARWGWRHLDYDKRREIISNMWKNSVTEFNNLDIYLNDTPLLTPTRLRSHVRRMVRKQKIELVIVDYLQLMSSGEKQRRGSREREVAALSRNCKIMAREEGVSMLVLAQLNRDAANSLPRLEHLRESGALEQDADLVMFIHRPRFNEDRSDPQAELHVAKQRSGPCGLIGIEFDLAKGAMKDTGRIYRSGKP
jgi:replicative DNA helicase